MHDINTYPAKWYHYLISHIHVDCRLSANVRVLQTVWLRKLIVSLLAVIMTTDILQAPSQWLGSLYKPLELLDTEGQAPCQGDTNQTPDILDRVECISKGQSSSYCSPGVPCWLKASSWVGCPMALAFNTGGVYYTCICTMVFLFSFKHLLIGKRWDLFLCPSHDVSVCVCVGPGKVLQLD